MKLNIRGEKIEVTPAIKEYLETKIERLDKYFEEPETITAYILVKVDNLAQIVEVTIPTKSVTLRREVSHEDLYAAIDLVLDKLERQIRKNKTKIKKRYKNTLNLEYSLPEEPEEEMSKIIRRKEITSKPMDEEEAILQMELLDHDFFVFKNSSEDCISVVYKRKKEGYGILNIR